MNQMSSAYSDDGIQMRERSQTEYIGGIGRGLMPIRDIQEEDELAGSITAAMSEHRARI